MTESEKFLDKILTYVDDSDKHWFMCHKADIKAYAKIYHKEQLNLCGVRFELPNDEIFKQDIVNLKNPLEEFYYYEAPSHSKWELAEFKQSLKKALDFLKGN